MKGRLSLICHGPTISNREGRFPADEPLEERAASQVDRLLPRLGSIGSVSTSPALRARQTAAALSREYTVEPRLRECDYGRWQGLSIADLAETEPEALALWMTDFSAAPHGGETLLSVLDRVGSWLDARIGDSGHAVVVTHATVVRAAILHILGAPTQAFWRMDVEPFSITEMTTDGNRWQLRLTNAVR